MDHIFPCTPQAGGGGGENISRLYPTCYSTKVYMGGILYICNSCKT